MGRFVPAARPEADRSDPSLRRGQALASGRRRPERRRGRLHEYIGSEGSSARSERRARRPSRNRCSGPDSVSSSARAHMQRALHRRGRDVAATRRASSTRFARATKRRSTSSAIPPGRPQSSARPRADAGRLQAEGRRLHGELPRPRGGPAGHPCRSNSAPSPPDGRNAVTSVQNCAGGTPATRPRGPGRYMSLCHPGAAGYFAQMANAWIEPGWLCPPISVTAVTLQVPASKGLLASELARAMVLCPCTMLAPPPTT